MSDMSSRGIMRAMALQKSSENFCLCMMVVVVQVNPNMVICGCQRDQPNPRKSSFLKWIKDIHSWLYKYCSICKMSSRYHSRRIGAKMCNIHATMNEIMLVHGDIKLPIYWLLFLLWAPPVQWKEQLSYTTFYDIVYSWGEINEIMLAHRDIKLSIYWLLFLL